jgi:alkylation response protein AidB-like acyl-CoA dehydrogenase
MLIDCCASNSGTLVASLAAMADPLLVARELARELSVDAVARDRRGGTPKRERDRLRQSGLLRLIIPTSLGGLGAGWPETLRIVRELARADGSIAHVFGFQHLLLATVRLFGTEAQWTRAWAESARHDWFWGNALNPLDERTRSRPVDGARIFAGSKSFCSGARDSDRLIVSAIQEGQSRLVIAAIPTSRAGIVIRDDWDNMGQRQTDSGTVELHDVRIDEDEILSTPGPLSTPFAALRPCIAQLTLANVFLGIADGALAAAAGYTRGQRRPWIASTAPSATQDPYVLHHYGELWLALQATEQLVERAAESLQSSWATGESLTAEARAHTAIAIATAKAQATRAGLDVTQRIFDVTGARATSAAAGFDRYWRNLRTLTLHDPVDYKLRELGDWFLNAALPKPSFYS